MIDLHSHTTASDGEHDPAELVALAVKAGVTTLAVTDHDTVAGLSVCSEAAQRLGLTLVKGIEISAMLHRRQVHVLGHFIDVLEPGLQGYTERLKRDRETRMERMVAKLKSMGIPVAMEQVQALAGDAHLARPHLARVLVQLGLCTSPQQAFDRFLGDGRPAAVEHRELPAPDAIALIHAAGGVATLAHPGSSKIERHDLVALKAAGLDGLEVEHSDHPPSLRAKFHALARQLDLVATAGSDFHGQRLAPDRHLGSASLRGGALEQLRSRCSKRPHC
jgi:predicted metal-dependent phosphoesterase TrpH